MEQEIQIKKAIIGDTVGIKALADSNKDSLGFVIRPAIENSIIAENLYVAKYDHSIVGYVRFHHRLDGVTKIYEICVDSGYRRKNIGMRIIKEVKNTAVSNGQSHLALKCPEDLRANTFYKKVGFYKEGIEMGRKRKLVLWNTRL
jgi:ribosomal protein S18 acetylase RimI-like enzyme